MIGTVCSMDTLNEECSTTGKLVNCTKVDAKTKTNTGIIKQHEKKKKEDWPLFPHNNAQ